MNHAKFCFDDFLKILRAPGEGLLTVSTGSGQAASLLQKFYPKNAYKQWFKLLPQRISSQSQSPFCILGVPSDSGGGICRGAAHGPLYIRQKLYSSKPEWADYDLGDIPCIPQLSHDEMLNKVQLNKSGQALWGNYCGQPVSPLNILEDFLSLAWDENPAFKPLVLGGDHSISGAIFQALDNHGLCEELAVLHFDAHTDLLESRFGVDHCFATWTAHAIKKLGNPSTWVQVGVRASRKPKAHWQSEYKVQQYWAQELRGISADAFSEKVIGAWKKKGAKYLYITNDIDGTDSANAPSTGTPENKGLDPKWVAKVIKNCSRALPLVGADLVEVAPVLGSSQDVKKTLKCAVEYLKALHWT